MFLRASQAIAPCVWWAGTFMRRARPMHGCATLPSPAISLLASTTRTCLLPLCPHGSLQADRMGSTLYRYVPDTSRMHDQDTWQSPTRSNTLLFCSLLACRRQTSHQTTSITWALHGDIMQSAAEVHFVPCYADGHLSGSDANDARSRRKVVLPEHIHSHEAELTCLSYQQDMTA